MKFASLRPFLFPLLAIAIPFTTTQSQAKTNCPGNLAGIRPRMVARSLIVVPVTINQAGPFDFMVDTGSQLNVIDPALAAQLHLKPQGTVGLVATASYSRSFVAVLDSLQAGPQVVRKPLVAIQELVQIQATDRQIRGVLGENFLAHFDVLIDYAHRLLCFDEADVLRDHMLGERIPLIASKDSENDLPFSPRLVVSVNLSDTGTRPILLQVDSGSDGAILYAGKSDLEEPLLKRARPQGSDVSDARRKFAVLPPQNMKLGSRTIRGLLLVTPVSSPKDVPDREEDGVLATVLFRRLYVCHSEHFVIFDPR